jgi:RNA polymerase sigma factor (sigma-70 family)
MDRTELERSLERLHEQNWRWALACCWRDRELAEEALQSAYLRILSGRARFDDRSPLRNWVFGVIRLSALEELRRRRLRWTRESHDDEATHLAMDPGLSAQVTAEQMEVHDALIAALGTLSSRQRGVLDLVFYHGMTIEDAAGVMGLSVGSARTHYTRGKKALVAALAQTRSGAVLGEREESR